MKKDIETALLIMMGLVMFTSCEDDNDSNPIVKTPTEFHLNTPALAATNIDLTNSSAIVFTCSQLTTVSLHLLCIRCKYR